MNRNKKHRNRNRNKQKKQKDVDNESPTGEFQDLPDLLEVETKLPYVIKHSDVMGRYLVASRDLRPGEVLMREPPLVVGPCQGCAELCLACYQPLLQDGGGRRVRCPGCGWLVCGPACPGLGQRYGHSEAECQLLATAKLRPADDSVQRYQAIVPLRCLLLRALSPPCWQKLQQMEAHNAVRRQLPHWQTNQREVVDRVRSLWGMTQFTEDELHTICGYLEVNCFEVGQNGRTARALYPSAFLIAHECVPNTCHTDSEDFEMCVRTAVSVPRGQMLSLSYAHTLQSTMKRREHLKESKFFDCCCGRCADPTEMGTYMGAINCPKCNKGTVLSSAPLEPAAQWRCTNAACQGFQVSGDTVRKLVEKLSDELEARSSASLPELEALLTSFQRHLHPRHYLCVGVLHSLSQLYGKSAGFEINQLTEDQLKRKRDVCQELMKVFDVVEPGSSKLRGVTLYELHAPVMMLATRRFERKQITRQELRAQLKLVASCLDEAGTILSYEPERSIDRDMGVAAQDALEQLIGSSRKQLAPNPKPKLNF